MLVTLLGHAALYLETEDQRILIDPVFAESLVGGALVYHPARRIDRERMPAPTTLLVTHGHFDHFHAPSLEPLSKQLPVLAPDDPELLEGLRRLGFSRISVCVPWRALELGKTRLLPTPSAHEEAELGVVVADSSGTFWHMADGEVSPADARRVLGEHPRIDLVCAKYQPVVRASMGHLRTRGARFDKEEVVEWLETACSVDPALVVPYASGLAFAGRHSWFNRYAFPLSAEEAAELVRRRLGPERAAALLPGDRIELEALAAPRVVAQSSPFVAALPSPSLVWEPIETAQLAGLDAPDERARLAERLDEFLETRFRPWLERELSRPESLWQQHRADGVISQLVVEAGAGERIERYIDYAPTPPRIVAGRHPFANLFTHVSGRALADVLAGSAPGLLFWLTGEARSYEKVVSVRDGHFHARPAILPQDELGDPVIFFLRRFGPEAVGEPTPVVPEPAPAAAVELSELEVLVRQGENPEVAGKKALLSLLALREAERIGMPIPSAEIEATSDEFRRRFGLEDAARMLAWLDEVGLDLPAYTRVMRGFTAVRLIQARTADEISPLVAAHAKVASIRASRR